MATETLDAKDMAILAALDRDVRASAREIGKRVRLKQETVHYRIKRLEERGIITGYWAYLALGTPYVIHKVIIKNKSLGAQKREELIAYLQAQNVVAWFANTEGNYDYVITVITDDDARFAKFVQDLLAKFGVYFQSRHILKSTAVELTNEKYLYPKNELAYVLPTDYLAPMPALDETDRTLLTRLSLDSRESYVALAEKLDLTPEAVSARVKRLIAQKRIVGFKLRVDWAKLGLAYYHVFITFQDQTKQAEVASYYIAHPHCVCTMHHVGYHDLHVEFVLPPDAIQSVMDELRDKFGDALASYELLHIREEYTMHMLR